MPPHPPRAPIFVYYSQPSLEDSASLSLTFESSLRTTATVNCEQLLLEHLPLIERTARGICRRNLFREDRTEEFVSALKLKLIEADYRVLREHRGESKLSTYLITVITNAFRDFRIQQWGKWRPSAQAKRQGPVAVLLERLVTRDGFTPSQAVEHLACDQRLNQSREQLEALLETLPARAGRKFVGAEALGEIVTYDGVERGVEARELAPAAARAQALLEQALERLSAEDLLILKLHYRDGAALSEVARRLGIEQRSLYARRDRSLDQLRGLLEGGGLTWAEMRSILGWEGAALQVDFSGRTGKGSAGSVPSTGGWSVEEEV